MISVDYLELTLFDPFGRELPKLVNGIRARDYKMTRITAERIDGKITKYLVEFEDLGREFD